VQKSRRITDRIEVLRPPRAPVDPAETGYDILFPIGPGDRERWIGEIDTIYLRGVPRGLREGGRVYLTQRRQVFWSAPVQEILSESNRISWITGERHGTGPCLIVDLFRGRRHRIDVRYLPTPNGEPWHNRQGMKYVTTGCKQFVRVGPRPPKGAMRARSSLEVALERALAKHLRVDKRARRLRIDDGMPRAVVEVDICVPELRLAVEFDGAWWHTGRRQHDRAKSERLRAAGMHVIRVRDRLPPIDPRWDIQVDGTWTSDDIARGVLNVLRRCRIHL
jgi:very-short-patch-repair endonuclease